MAVTIADVEKIVATLPTVTVGTKWGNRTWMVEDKGFAWQRPFSKADLERFGDETPPKGDILAVRVESLDAKDAVLAMELPGFFTIAHFNGYAAVLIELRKARAKDVRTAIQMAFAAVAATATSTPARRRASPRPSARSRAQRSAGTATSAASRSRRA